MSENIKLTQPTPQALEDATKSSCSARPTQSADFWAVQYQYAAAVCVSPALKPEEQDAWTAFMQHAYGRYVAAIRASLHPSIAAAVGERDDHKDTPKLEAPPPPKRVRLTARCANDSCSRPSDVSGILVCTVCTKAHHTSCLPHPPIFELVRQDSYSCEDCKVCSACADAQETEDMVFCDACDRGFHLRCHGLTELPQDDQWFCRDCSVCSVCQVKCDADEVRTLNFFKKRGNIVVKLCSSCFAAEPQQAPLPPCRSCGDEISARQTPFATKCSVCNACVSFRIMMCAYTVLGNFRMEWYFAESNSHMGPVDEAYLGQAFASQHIDGETLVWRYGMEKWAPISEVPELKAALRADEESEDAAEATPPNTPDQVKQTSPKTAEEKKLHNAERRRRYRERQKTKRALGFATNVKRNVHVYVSGLPRNEVACSVEALAEIFKQAGVLQTDTTTQRPRVKLYSNEDGKLKGDALVSYVNTESVDLAVRFLHGTEFEGQTISVIPAKFDHIPTTSLQLAELQTRARELQVYDRGKRRKIQERRQEGWGVAVSSGKPLLMVFHCWTADTAQTFGVDCGLYVWIAARLMVALKQLFGESVIKKVTPINAHPQGVCVLRADTNDSAECIMKVMLDAPEARLWAGGEVPLRFDVYQKGVDLSSQVPEEDAWVTPERSDAFVRSLGEADLPVAQRLIRETTHAIRLNGPPRRDPAILVKSPDAEQAARLDNFGLWLDEQSSSDDEFAVRTEQ